MQIHLSANTFSTCWNDTTAQIILKDKDDNDAPMLPALRFKWQVLKMNKDIGKNMIFPNKHYNTFSKRYFFYRVGIQQP